MPSACSPSNLEADAGGSFWVPGHLPSTAFQGCLEGQWCQHMVVLALEPRALYQLSFHLLMTESYFKTLLMLEENLSKQSKTTWNKNSADILIPMPFSIISVNKSATWEQPALWQMHVSMTWTWTLFGQNSLTKLAKFTTLLKALISLATAPLSCWLSHNWGNKQV